MMKVLNTDNLCRIQSPINRRTFLKSAVGVCLSSTLGACARQGRRPRILLRNAWQSQNIGDIAHYLGLFELLENAGTDAEIRLWPGNLQNGADALLAKRFPKVIVLKGPEAIATAIKECVFFSTGPVRALAPGRT